MTSQASRSQKSPKREQSHSDAVSASSTRGAVTGVYVDVENLRVNAQQIIRSMVDTWPRHVPQPKLLCLYVRADYVELWRLWATSQFRNLTIVVKGVQHFSAHTSKNSADIAIATDAISDLLSGHVGYLAVVSDDSDFIALYAAVRDLDTGKDQPGHHVPFLWIITDRGDTLSTTVKQYFPQDAVHIVSATDTMPAPAPMPPFAEAPPAPQPPPMAAAYTNGGASEQNHRDDDENYEDVVDAVVRDIATGAFRSIDCQRVIRRYWPQHPLAGASGPHFGTEFIKKIWPILERRGARIVNPGQTPKRYEMNDQVKASVRQP